MDITLNWSGNDSDLDLFLFAPNGELTTVSGNDASTGEHIRMDSLTYPEYWAAVHAYYLAPAKLEYALTVQYGSSLSVAPALWQGTIAKGRKASLNFTLANDGTADSGITAQVLDYKNAEGILQSKSVSHTGDDTYTVVWKKSTSGFGLSDARYLNATLTWNNPSNDLDLVFLYRNGLVWNATRFRTMERNDLSGIGQEDLKMIDIRSYLGYNDIGMGIVDTGGTQGYTLKLNFTDESACTYAAVTPSSISSLPANSGRTVQVNLSTGSLILGNTYDSALVLTEGGREYARVPLRLTVAENDTTTTTVTTSTTMTTTSTTTSMTTTSSTTTTIQTTTTRPTTTSTTTISSQTTTTLTIPGDANGDGRVDYADLLILAGSYGKSTGQNGYDARADFNGDGKIDYQDLLVLAANYGK